MHKRDVIVKDEEIQDQHCQMDHQREKQANDASTLSFLVVVVEPEEITVAVLVSEVHDVTDEEVKHRSKSIPRDEFAQLYREAEDVLLG